MYVLRHRCEASLHDARKLCRVAAFPIVFHNLSVLLVAYGFEGSDVLTHDVYGTDQDLTCISTL